MKDFLVVAEKEIRDYFTGKRFLALFAVVMLLCIAGIVSGLNGYNEQLKYYKDNQVSQATDPIYQQMIANQQKLIHDAEASNGSEEEIGRLKASLQSMTNPPMPSVLLFMNAIGLVFMTVGALLAIVMGFNLITREKESGTLKLLLTRPTYRDSVINGKAIAGFATIVAVFGAAFLITIAIMLLYNIVPGVDDLARIVVYFIVAMLYMLLFFALALLISTVSPSSTVSIMVSLGLFVFFTVLLAMGSLAGGWLAGPYPEYPAELQAGPPESAAIYDPNSSALPYPVAVYPGSSGVILGYNQSDPQMIAYQQASDDYNRQLQAYYQRQQQISDLVTLVSPIGNFGKLNDVITSKYAPGQTSYWYSGIYGLSSGQTRELNVLESLAYRWTYLLVFIVEIMAAFGLSYVLFMRADVT